tara:strand:- start:20374 stop:22368 length:1995 start_codon:yes stop_codon:yes gene_type:complete
VLRSLAESCGVTTTHIDGLGQTVQASDAALLTVLQALGIAIETADQAEAILNARQGQGAALLAPCVAGEEGQPCVLSIGHEAGHDYVLRLQLESGETRELRGQLGEGEGKGEGKGEGEGEASSETASGQQGVQLDLGQLPIGYHHATLTCGEASASAHLIIAPKERFGAGVANEPTNEPANEPSRQLGLFAPLYAIRSERDYGVGDFTDLARLMRWAGEQGIDFVGTLPLSAGNYQQEFQTSPYSPVSRLFWNEIYLDVEKLAAEFPSEHLQELRGHSRFESERKRLAEIELVDYKKTSELKTRLLYRMADVAWDSMADVFAQLLKDQPELHHYAQFRAVMETTGTTYHHWAPAQRAGNLEGAAFDKEDYRYHVFVQWAAQQQLGALSEAGCGLYLDLSVGAGGSSFDVWRHQESFVSGVDVGAPPDALFEGGQNWALPPLHPERSRATGHRYFAECVRANMRHASILRVDHVMGLHRLYWVPSDLGATEGLYVRYPADELYAILRIEAVRNQCALVGEDLGTVPEQVRPAMESSGMHGLYVGQFSVEGGDDGWPTLQPASKHAFASLNTHDTPTFAGWFATTDLQCDPMHLMKTWTEALAEGPAAAVIVALEDLWLEVAPQNQPGTGQEQPNWRRRFQQSLTEITDGDEPGAWLRHLRHLRST